jgi:DNA-binding transcriptional ArsR family regulator
MEFSELKPEAIEKAANMIKAISHPTRLAILGHLDKGNHLTVTEIHKLLDIEQPTTSHHLGILKDQNLSNLVRCISDCATE